MASLRIDPNEKSDNLVEDATKSAPCANSSFTLKEQILMLDDMVLNDENEDKIPATDDKESLAWTLTSRKQSPVTYKGQILMV